MSKALVILSGGQDSTACLARAVRNYDEVMAVTFNYGQRHVREIEAAKAVAKLCGVTQHEIIELGPILQGTSPLTDSSQPLEQYTDFTEMTAVIGDRVEKTFVPMRNALFLTIAANRAVVHGASIMVTGVCEEDNANYPDCRSQFIHAQENSMNLALGYYPHDRGYIRISTPLMNMSKAAAIGMMLSAGDYPLLAFTHTAYDGQYPPVGNDHATLLRAQGFVEAGLPDPLIVRAVLEGALDAYPETINYQCRDAEFMRRLVLNIATMQDKLNSVGAAA